MHTKKFKVAEQIKLAKSGASFRNYEKILPLILKMMEMDWSGLSDPSKYWEEELDGFTYIFDASPLVVQKLREHCYHLTGLRSYEYRVHHAHKADVFATKLQALRAVDRSNLWVSENSALGGFGHLINGDLVNIDTLKFYESMIAMDKSGILDGFRGHSERRHVIEIGGGWGGFAYHFKTLFPNTTYIIVDLPPTLLFSAVYLSSVFPRAKVFVYGQDGSTSVPGDLSEYDFVFLPHFATSAFDKAHIDLAINMISFQEMTSAQVSHYVKWLSRNNCPCIYSHNRGRSPHNLELSNVHELISECYELEKIDILPVPYTILSVPSGKEFVSRGFNRRNARSIANFLISSLARRVEKGPSVVRASDYLHHIGRRRKTETPGTL